jgi:hypothetical protein
MHGSRAHTAAKVDATATAAHALQARHAAHYDWTSEADDAWDAEPEGEGVILWAAISTIAYTVILVGCMAWRMAR